MNHQQRLQLIEHQSRAFTEGTVEYINDEWIFFDEEGDEAILLNQYVTEEVEVLRANKWVRGILQQDATVQLKGTTISLQDNDQLRIRKHLIYSLEILLEEIDDDAFIQFITTLNSMNFSIYDCIYCHNHLAYLQNYSIKQGVNILIFDNSENVCAVHHHFSYGKKKQDRFEYTLNTGKRIVIEKFNRK
ncbi:DUF2777 domain-containing protein [Aeribacillus pallidus]|jgi:Protein of unknown function (DUF2777)|uniref:DUF2777 domain-containing protein n=1 Tax=Aeribacillus pallidus TaxID=33936 RepID=UPI003D24A2C1